MVNHDLFSKFQDRYVDKQLEITYDGGTITNSELFSESMQLTESLCSDSQLKFGSCEASVIKFKIANVFLSMFGKQITVTMYLDGNRDKPFQIGIYKVASDTPTADRKWRNIVAYDAMYDMLNADVSDWYNKVLPNKDSTVTLKEFRTKFLQHFGLDQEDITLINDKMIVEKTIEPSELSGKTVITCICEINGCFGHIGRDGKFHWIYLTQGIEGLYPANDLYPADDLFPRDPKGERIGQNGSYTKCKYSDFVTKTITKLQIRASENDIGAISGTDTDNCYIIQDNFLVYGKGKDDFQTIADNVLSKIKDITYRPYQATVQGNPCYEVGDAVRLFTKYELIESYILSRTLKGIQALRDSFTTKGEERYDEKVNSVRNSIIQLKGKTNELERNVEETKSTITDVEKGLQSQITQNASSITAEVKRATDAETQLSSKIAINADSITAEVKRAQGKEEQLSSSIKINADSIKSEVSRATTAEGKLSSRITQTADSITAEVSRATTAEGNLSSLIKVNADNILLKVSKGDVSSEISQEAGKISIKSNRISIESTNFVLTEDGTIKAVNGEFSGKITVGEGTIGGFTITSNAIYNGKSSLESMYDNGVFISTSGICIGAKNIFGGDNYFKATTSGEIAIKGTNFSLDNNGLTVLNNSFTSSGITLRMNSSSIPITITDSITIGNSSSAHVTITSEKTTLHASGSWPACAVIGSSGIEIYSSIHPSGTHVTITSGSITCSSNISLSADYSNAVILGSSSNKLGFFGSSGSTKKSVGTLSSTPTVDNLKDKLNSLINALKDYNFIS